MYLTKQMKTKLKAIIVDDEQSARDNLRYLTEKYCSNIKIIAEANKVATAVEQIKTLQPNLVFLDIEMPKQNGFALFNYFDELNFHVVFITAYNHYAVKAFEVSAVDYLLKPIDIERLKEAESKVLKQVSFNKNFEVLEKNIQTSELKNIAIPYKSDFIVVKIHTIICIQACRAYSNVLVFNTDKQTEKTYTYAKKLVYFEENLPKKLFVRVHRSWVINLNFIQSYSKKECKITLKNKQQIPISTTYKKAFEQLFI